MTKASVTKTARLLHLYFGVFISPALLFFAFTGAMQTFGLHEPNRTGTYQPPTWIAVLGHLHKKAELGVDRERPKPGAAANGPGAKNAGGARPDPTAAASVAALAPERGAGASATAADPERGKDASPGVTAPGPGARIAPTQGAPAGARKHNALPEKIFFLLVSVGLFVSTFTGLYMSYTYNRNKRLVTACLVAGVVVPLVLLLF